MKSELVQAVFEGGKTAHESIKGLLQTSAGDDVKAIQEALSLAAVEIRLPSGASEDERNKINVQQQYQLAIVYEFLRHLVDRPILAKSFAESGGLTDVFQRVALSGLNYSCKDILNFSKKEETGLWRAEISKPEGVTKAFSQLLESQIFFSTNPIDIFFDAVKGDKILSVALSQSLPNSIRHSSHKMQTLVNVLDRAASNDYMRKTLADSGFLNDIYLYCKNHSALLSNRAGFIVSQIPEWQCAVFK